MRRISYYLVPGKGLAREEDAQATSDNAQDPSFPSDDQYIIAPEVVNVTFSYFDGTSWQTSWDGTNPTNPPSPNVTTDQITPYGSPRAIKIMLELELPRDDFAVDPKAARKTKQYTHVIVVGSANGSVAWNTATATAQTGGGNSP